MTDKLIKITEFEVSKLFGMFDHTIPLKNGGITIIHGPNGYGKTAILNIITSIFNWDIFKLKQMDFEKIAITFSNKTLLSVIRKANRQEDKITKAYSDYTLEFKYSGSNIDNQKFEVKESEEDEYFISPLVTKYVPNLYRLDREKWRDLSTQEVFSQRDIIYKYWSNFPKSITEKFPDIMPPEWLNKLITENNVSFIQTQRLLSYSNMSRRNFRDPDEVGIQYTVSEYSQDIKALIKTRLAEYASYSQKLDSTFPQRFVSEKNDILSIENIKHKLDELTSKRQRLKNIGLLDQDIMPNLPDSAVSKDTEKVLSMYVKDTEDKLGQLDDILARIEMFLKIINEKFLFKQISISQDKGFVFSSHSGCSTLTADKLSSGEQQELVMFYELLFKAKKNSLILMDEPEISLHVSWQEKFLRDIQSIAKLSKLYFIIATHSPEIISNQWDLTVELKAPKNLSAAL